VWLLPPKSTTFSPGRRSIIILNVSQRFARANQEKISKNTLYYITKIKECIRNQQSMMHEGLKVEEEQVDDAMARLVQSEEVHDSILRSQLNDYI
jgi:hypothetical protein